MIKTYVYGTPHGFNLYGKDSALESYFQGFYISSRRNRRLMINRQANGSTVYNYLRYDLLEAGGRPHAFFGMSLLIDDFKFCPEFKKVLEWCDWLFEKVVNERSVFFHKNEDDVAPGTLKYAINRFDECPGDVEWLKSVLPNIFSVEARTTLLPIDGSFESGKTGQVLGLNDAEDDEVILKAFKKYSWVALAPEYPLLKDSSIENAATDLDYGDLFSKLGELNSRLLPIAIDPSKADSSELETMQKVVGDSVSNLETYSKGIVDPDEKKRFSTLLQSYRQLNDSIAAIIAKKSAEDKGAEESADSESGNGDKSIIDGEGAQTQYCFTCKKYKSISEFRSPSSTKCIACESLDKKVCQQCGQSKTSDHFSPGSEVCNECKSKKSETRNCKVCHRNLPLDKFEPGSSICTGCSHRKSWWDSNKKKLLYGLIAFLLIGSLSFILFRQCSSKPIFPRVEKTKSGLSSKKEVYNAASDPASTSPLLVDSVYLDSLIHSSESSVKMVYDYMSDKTDKERFYPTLHTMINDKIWSIIDSAEVPFSKEKVNESIIKYKIDNQAIIDDIGYSFDTKYWQGLVNDYAKLSSYLSKNTLTNTEFQDGKRILSKYQEWFGQAWQHSLDLKKPQESSSTNGDTGNNGVKTSLQITITHYDQNENVIGTQSFSDNKPIGLEGFKGEFYKITTNTGQISFKKGPFEAARPETNSVYIKLSKVDSQVFTVSGKQITITAKNKAFKRE